MKNVYTKGYASEHIGHIMQKLSGKTLANESKHFWKVEEDIAKQFTHYQNKRGLSAITPAKIQWENLGRL